MVGFGKKSPDKYCVLFSTPEQKEKEKEREREKSMGWIVPSLAQHIGLGFYSGVTHKIFFFKWTIESLEACLSLGILRKEVYLWTFRIKTSFQEEDSSLSLSLLAFFPPLPALKSKTLQMTTGQVGKLALEVPQLAEIGSPKVVEEPAEGEEGPPLPT